MPFIFLILIIIPGEAKAERFFQQNNTWYEKIPANPAIRTNSADYINDISTRVDDLYISTSSDWGHPVYQATADTPLTEVSITHFNTVLKNYILDNHWNDVPIPSGALPAGNDLRCRQLAGDPTVASNWLDAHMTVISYDGTTAWDFYAGSYCNAPGEWYDGWMAKNIRKWDLTGDGINYPHDNHGSVRAASVPLLHGVITHNEVINEPKINHALLYLYNVYVSGNLQNFYPEKDSDYPENTQVYPSYQTWGLSESRPNQLLYGMRIQLDPSFNCASLALGLNQYEQKVCVALQEYGAIMVDNSGAGNSHVLAESPYGKLWSWSGILKNTYLGIPMSAFRVLEPIYPQQTTGDTQAPTVPAGVTATAISYSQINLSWTVSTDPAITGQATSGVTGYKVFRNGSQVATVTTTSYTNTGLTASTSYSYTVSAYDAAGNVSAQSAEVSATTNSDTATPAAPQGLLVQ